jgi:hypothetical protein
MKVYEDRIDVPKTYKVLVERKCDLCGFKARNLDWNASCYEINETEISITIDHKEGENYPESCNSTSWKIDMCPNCFKNKLIPWLKDQGANIKEIERDW